MDHTIYLTAVFCFYRKAIAVSAHRNNRILQIGAIASGALNATELLRICKLLENTARVKSYGRHDTVDGNSGLRES